MSAREWIADRLWWSVPSKDNAEAKAITEQKLDAYRCEVLAEAIAAAAAEQLVDETGHPRDEGYNAAIDDVVSALSRLAEGGDV